MLLGRATFRSTDKEKHIASTSIWHGTTQEAVVAEARNLINKQLPQASRRQFLARGLTLGGLGCLSGCSIDGSPTAESSVDADLAFQ